MLVYIIHYFILDFHKNLDLYRIIVSEIWFFIRVNVSFVFINQSFPVQNKNIGNIYDNNVMKSFNK